MTNHIEDEKTLYAVPIEDTLSTNHESFQLPKFLRYIVGTKDEVRSKPLFLHNVRLFSTMRDITDTFADVAPASERLYTKGQIAELEKGHKKIIMRATNVLERSGTFAYLGGSLALTMIEPISGIVLLTDSLVRLGRMQFRNDPPVGIVGTVRERYYSKNVKKMDE